ncbi:MAG: lytic transglycosylase domain-containing protein [Sciscionella sp.]
MNEGDRTGDDVPKRARASGTGLAARLGLVAVAVALAGGGVWGLSKATQPAPTASAQDIPALSVRAAPVKPGSAMPAAVKVAANITPIANTSPATTEAAGHSGGGSASHRTGHHGANSLTTWATRVSRLTGVPERALWAYGNAELALRAAEPGCHLSWATLAGIGRVESDHGRFGGARIEPNGDESKPVIGVPLNGSGGTAAIGATGGGTYDGDPVFDHAVGPMQFIPSTWRKYASDGNGDGIGNPQNIDDAALGAARYLCVGGRNMGTATGWWSGLMSYNNSVEYGQKVFGLADEYAKRARQPSSGVGR